MIFVFFFCFGISNALTHGIKTQKKKEIDSKIKNTTEVKSLSIQFMIQIKSKGVRS